MTSKLKILDKQVESLPVGRKCTDYAVLDARCASTSHHPDSQSF